MTINQGLIILSAFCLGLACRPYITTFPRKAWSVGILGTGFGVLLASCGTRHNSLTQRASSSSKSSPSRSV